MEALHAPFAVLLQTGDYPGLISCIDHTEQRLLCDQASPVFLVCPLCGARHELVRCPIRLGWRLAAGEERGAHRAGALRDGDLVLLAAAAAVQGLQGARRNPRNRG